MEVRERSRVASVDDLDARTVVVATDGYPSGLLGQLEGLIVPTRGQVIATQGLMGNIAALIPTLLAGIATDIFGVKPIAVAIAVCIVIAAMAAHMLGRRNIEAPALAPQT